MFPDFAANNPSDVTSCYLKLAGYFGIAETLRVALTNVCHIVVRQFREAVLFAAHGGIFSPALFSHVAQIVGIGSDPKMERIYAARVVAGVADKHFLGNRPLMEFVGDTMGRQKLSANAKYAIAIAGSSLPFPAFGGIPTCAVFPKGGNKVPVASAMPMNIPKGLTFDISLVAIVGFCDRRLLSAATHARSAWIGVGEFLSRPITMPSHEAYWLAFNPAIYAVVLVRNRSFLSTPAVTKAVRNLIRGIMRLHQKSPFSMSNPGTCSSTLPGSFAWCYRCNYSIFGLVTQWR